MIGSALRRAAGRLAIALERSFPPLIDHDAHQINLTLEWILLLLALSSAILKTLVFLMVLGG